MTTPAPRERVPERALSAVLSNAEGPKEARAREQPQVSWHFENATPMLGTITEGPAWDRRHLYFTHGALGHLLRAENTGLTGYLLYP